MCFGGSSAAPQTQVVSIPETPVQLNVSPTKEDDTRPGAKPLDLSKMAMVKGPMMNTETNTDTTGVTVT